MEWIPFSEWMFGYKKIKSFDIPKIPLKYKYWYLKQSQKEPHDFSEVYE